MLKILNNTPYKQWRMCNNKVKYTSVQQAKEARDRMQLKNPHRKIRDYECPYCYQFHIGGDNV